MFSFPTHQRRQCDQKIFHTPHEVVTVTACWGPAASHAHFTHGTPGPGIHTQGTPNDTKLLTLQGLLQVEFKAPTWPQTAPDTCPDYKPWTKVKKSNVCHGGGLLYRSTPGPRDLQPRSGSSPPSVSGCCSPTHFEFLGAFLFYCWALFT